MGFPSVSSFVTQKEVINVFPQEEVNSSESNSSNQNNRVTCAVSNVFNNIKKFFSSIGGSISSLVKDIQIERQKERIQNLQKKSDFKFNVGLEGDVKDQLDIQEALLKSSLSKNYADSFVHIDRSGRLCESKDSALTIAFNHRRGDFEAFPGPKASNALLVNEKPLELNDYNFSYQADKNKHGNQFYSLTHKDEIPLENDSILPILKIEILNLKGQIIQGLQEKSDYIVTIENQGNSEKDRLDLQKKFLEASLSKDPVAIYVNKNGKPCEYKDSVIMFIGSNQGFEAIAGNNYKKDFLLNGKEFEQKFPDEPGLDYSIYPTDTGKFILTNKAGAEEILKISVPKKEGVV